MKNPSKCALIILILTFSLHSGISQETAPPSQSITDRAHKILETKFGYFWFIDSKIRNIYDKEGLDLQLSLTWPAKKWLNLYGSIEYFQKEGRTTNLHNSVSVWGVPISLGLKPLFSIKPWAEYYFAIGPRYVFITSHTTSSSLQHTLSQNGLGGFANTGLNFYPYKRLVIDLFLEASYCHLSFHPSKRNIYGEGAQVGGVVAGLGLGYAF